MLPSSAQITAGGEPPTGSELASWGNLVCCGESLHCACNTNLTLNWWDTVGKHGCSWTLVAQPYPASLCKFLALAVAETLKPEGRRVKLDIASCAKQSGRGMRIGEAAHPGPRVRVPADPFITDLEMVDTVRPATRLIQGSCSGEVFSLVDAKSVS